MHHKPFKTLFKLNSYPKSISRRGPVTPSTTFFLTINLTKTIKIYLLFQKLLKNGRINLYFQPYNFDKS